MTKYQCDECKKIFIHPMKVINKFSLDDEEFFGKNAEHYCCPFCQAQLYSEVKETVQIENVYICEFTKAGGEQTEIKRLLAEGWVIADKYSGKYVLELPKQTPKKDDPTLTESLPQYRCRECGTIQTVEDMVNNGLQEHNSKDYDECVQLGIIYRCKNCQCLDFEEIVNKVEA